MLKHLVLPLAAAASLMLQGCINVDVSSVFPTSDFQEVIVEEGSSATKILILDIDGPITSGPSSPSGFFGSSDSTVTSVAERLEKARDDAAIKAVILRVDSPGGGVTASDVIYSLLRDFRRDTGTPIYVSMLDVATSGGYYVSMAADEIYAHPTTITGSIGVIALFPQLWGLGNKIGVEVVAIKSGEMKDMGSPFNPLEAGERQVLQGTVNNLYERFLTVVAAGRPGLGSEAIRQIADGRIYTASEAEELGLIDGVMYLEELLDHVEGKQRIEGARVVIYRKTSADSVGSLYARAPAVEPKASAASPQAATVNLLNGESLGLPASGSPVFQYRWVPGMPSQ